MKKAIICFPKINRDNIEPAQFPTGLYKIKAYCIGNYDIKIIDERLSKNIIEEIDKVLDNDVLCLGLSVMTGQQIASAIAISKYYHGKVKIVWGGVHPTILPENTIGEEYIDFIIRGDGEEAFLNLLDFLDKNTIERELFLSKNNHNLSINCLNDLNRSNIDFLTESISKEYFIKRDGFKKAFSIETSRGCPHKCGFCHNTILNHKYRTVETEYVISSIKNLYELYNIDGIIFQEDNFFVDKNRIQDIVKYLEKNDNIGWKANSRISYFTELNNNFMNQLVKSNCKLLQYGIESGSDRILKLINKKISVAEIKEINRNLAQFDIRIRYNFIIGFPTETIEEIHTTLELIDILRKDNQNSESPFVNIYTPYPGTPVYDLAVEQGFIPPATLYDWSKISWNETNSMIKDKKLRSEIFRISNQYAKKSNYLR